jgi:hypothetical protein
MLCGGCGAGSAQEPATDGSILDVRLLRQFTNSDAFFAFSAMRVRFGQVTARANFFRRR